MGTWGIGIFSNDDACDARDEFLQVIESGASAALATKKVLSSFAKSLRDPGVAADVLLALASTQITHRCLQKPIKERATKLIKKGAAITNWKDSRDLKRRKATVAKFQKRLASAPVQAAKASLRPPRRILNWPIGQLFVYRMPTGELLGCFLYRYGDAVKQKLPVIGLLGWRGKAAPQVSELQRAKILFQTLRPGVAFAGGKLLEGVCLVISSRNLKERLSPLEGIKKSIPKDLGCNKFAPAWEAVDHYFAGVLKDRRYRWVRA